MIKKIKIKEKKVSEKVPKVSKRLSKPIKIRIKDLVKKNTKNTNNINNDNINNDFMFYPLLTDNDFDKKIFVKKEFNDFKTKFEDKSMEQLCSPKDFALDASQNFLSNYINPDTPYNGVLLLHGTGVGKTCTSISIAEKFKNDLKKNNKRILVITVLKNNFKKELFNDTKDLKKKRPEEIVQCTGRAYEIPEDLKHYSIKQRRIYVDNLINKYYQLFGYREFANYIIRNTGWNGEEDKIDDKILKYISKEFDDRVIIIDEIHNIKFDRNDYLKKITQPILKSIIKYAKNTKLVLMSATPMFDIPQEIIYIINLLLLNDNRPEILVNDYFYKDGTMKDGVENKFKELIRGYISYVRPEQLKFPIRLYPKNYIIPQMMFTITNEKIKPSNLLKYTPLIDCPMHDIQLATYQYYINKIIKKNKLDIDNSEDELNTKDNIDNSDKIDDYDDFNSNSNSNQNQNQIENQNQNNEVAGIETLKILETISIIVFPVDNSKILSQSIDKNISKNINKSIQIGSFGRKGINNETDNGRGGFYKHTQQSVSTSKKITRYRYQSHAIFNKNTKNEVPFMDRSLIGNYSSKMASILENIRNTKGLIFIYSRFKDFGTIPIALMLEQNGYTRYTVEGESNLLDYSPNKSGGGGVSKKICYLCSKEANHIDHKDTASNNYHRFKLAKYVLVFGGSQDIVKIKKEDAVNKFSQLSNKYGEEIKIFIGTKTVSEGLDFKMIRQIHILEPWYNLSRAEQIIGRGIRRCSHINLKPEERNVEIYQYVSSYPKNSKYYKTETIDIRNYRKSELKDVRIKNVLRLMKESAVDCNLFHDTNIFITNKKVKQITASNEVREILLNDEPYSQICDYKEDCNYKCNWCNNGKNKINTDTYNIRFAKIDIDKYKNKIKLLFRDNNIYTLEKIEDIIKNEEKHNYNNLFLYNALEELLNNKNEYIFDQFNRKGYLIYKGNYYIFQPIEYDITTLPMHYRLLPNDVYEKSVDLDIVDVKYQDQSINKKSISKINYNIDIKKYNENIKHIEYLIDQHKNIYLSNNSKYLKEYIYAVIDSVFNKQLLNDKINFITSLLNEYNNGNNLSKIKNIILEHFDDVLLRSNDKVFIEYKSESKSKSKSPNKINKINNKNNYVGFFLNNNYYCLVSFLDENNDDKSYIKCPDELVYKIEKYKKLLKKSKNKLTINKNLKYNIIYGRIDFDKNKYLFKIIDKTKEDIILTQEKKISKRSLIHGRDCRTFQIPKILETRKILGMYDYTDKKKRDFICADIEIYLRYKQNIETTDIIWFDE